VVIDIDPDHGGERSLAALLNERGPLPASRTVRTGSGGRHLYFSHPGEPVPNDTGRRLGPGLDVRGDGGYVIAPPSSHTSGGRYAVASHGGEIAALPDWLLDMLRRREPERRNYVVTAREHGDAWASAAVDGELRKLQGATPGIRNSTLNRVAFRLGQIIGAGLLDQSEIEQSLVEAGVGIGLGERETALTVRSGLTAGIDLPRGPVDRPVDLEAPGPALD
jgi:putative DNA primase/helicase